MSAEGHDLGRVAFATWVYLLHAGGVEADDAAVVDACRAIGAATDRAVGDAAGEELIARIDALFGGPSAPETALTVASRLYGDRARGDMGAGDREARTATFRRYQFGRGLPWLARIVERHDGKIVPTWLLIEKVDEQVHAMDPNPWNEVDEQRNVPVADFHVLWELDGCHSVSLR